MYAVLGLLAAVENVVPPVPSDAAVALGAFLSHRGVTTFAAVFLVTWVSNLVGAAGVYFVARRYGRRLFASPTGRRLLAPRSLAIIEREYLRFGIVGIFISRFLPGIRAVVPPFAGLVGLGAIRTLGADGARVRHLVRGPHHGGRAHRLGVGAHQRAHRQRQPDAVHRDAGRSPWPAASGIWCAAGSAGASGCWHATTDALDPAAPSFLAGTDIAEGSARQAAALVVLELAYADPVLTSDDRRLIAEHLHGRWGLGAGGTPPSPAPEEERRTRFADYARRLRKRVGRPERLELVERMWTVAFADGAIGAHEARLMHLAAELLGLKPAELADVSRRLQAQRDQ